MITYSGIIPDNPLDIEPRHIRLADIGHQLSRINRWNGASQAAFSVAEHSLHAQRLARVMAPEMGARMELLMLLHDAHEAYLGDIVTPIKRQLGPIYGVWARHIDRMVRDALQVPHPDKAEETWVEQIDRQAGRIECWSLFRAQQALDLCGPVDVEACKIGFTSDNGKYRWTCEVESCADLAVIEAQARGARVSTSVTCCQ
jgi:5'-deoxynucleotidase YfbR-like HD superfamily hydrolase